LRGGIGFRRNIALPASTTLFGRLFASIDHLLMSTARIAIRSGDLPRVGF